MNLADKIAESFSQHKQSPNVEDLHSLKKGDYVLKHDASGAAKTYQVHSVSPKSVKIHPVGYKDGALSPVGKPEVPTPGTYKKIDEAQLTHISKLSDQRAELGKQISNSSAKLRGAHIRAADAAGDRAREISRLQGGKELATKAFSITRIDFEAAFSRILARAVKGGARPNQIENLMLGLLQSSGQKAFQDGLREGGVNDLPDDSDLQEIQNIIANSIDYLDPLLQQAFSGDIAPLDVHLRAEMWANKTLTQFFNAGRISSDRNAMYEWLLGQTEKHCPDCARLNGQVHRFKDWYARDWLPQSDRLDCGGFRCDCKLMRTSNPAQGRF